MSIIGGFKNKINNTNKKISCGAVIVAAGKGSRMNSQLNKQFIKFNNKPVLAYTLFAFENCPDISEIVVVAREEDFFTISDIAKEYEITKLKNIVKGGATRQESVLHGVLEFDSRCKFLAVHDGARPFIESSIISSVISVAYIHNAAAAGVFLKDTIKEVDKDNNVVRTLDRSRLMAIQTPQVFEANLLKRALINAQTKNINVTDDCMAVEALGVNVKIVEGSYDNIKITTDEDLSICEAIIARESH